MHKILERHIKRIYGDIEHVPVECLEMLKSVSKTFTDYDKEFSLIERSLEISSAELTEANQRLREEISVAHENAEELKRLNKTMIDRELKMIRLKEEIARLKADKETP